MDVGSSPLGARHGAAPGSLLTLPAPAASGISASASQGWLEGHSGRSAFVLNAIGASLIVTAFLTICGWTILSAEDELVESAELSTLRWVDGALVESQALDHLLSTHSISPYDRTYLETIARSGNIVAFSIYDAAGDAVFSYAPAGRVEIAEHVDPAVTAQTPTEILHNGEDPTLPGVMARVSVPVDLDGGVYGSITVVTDQSAGFDIYRSEMFGTLALTGILTLIALANALGVAFLLRRKQVSDMRMFALAHQDGLTGLANRNTFTEMLESCFPAVRSGTQRIALHLVDLDGFKAVNDTFGHAVGDAVLQSVTRRLERSVGGQDIVARLGGDEFAVLQCHADATGTALSFAEALVENMRMTRTADGASVGVTVSVGTAIAPIHASSSEDLTRFADIALYRAKAEGRDRAVMFTPAMEDEINLRNALRGIVRNAVETEAFTLQYQPICRVSDRAVVAFEALARLRHPTGEGMIPPSDFIPVAESMGLMPRLGRSLLRQACQTAASWPPSTSVAVNLSAQQFSENIVATVEAALAESGLSPERLEIEITESLLIANETEVGAQVAALRALGVRIVMDDFGTGFSSLNYLWKFPFDKLKVDRSFFNSLDASGKLREVLQTIRAMGEAMHLTVVAEGIETEAQYAFVSKIGFDQVQGYLFGRPMWREDIARLLAEPSQASPR